jgi:hypothetical protein
MDKNGLNTFFPWTFIWKSKDDAAEYKYMCAKPKGVAFVFRIITF